jgi:NAD(P)-dependent dehydrogenase (short-subunit alcohol dehydrogenase family)
MQLVVLVTGGSSGIGREIVEAFLAAGYRVAATGRSKDRLVAAFGDRVLCIEADATVPTLFSSVIATVVSTYGSLDVLVNNAGGATFGQRLETATLESWDETFRLNARAPFFMMQAARSALIESRGCVVNFSSVLASRPAAGLGPYSAAKAAVDMITQTAALELAPHGVRVNCVAPATIQTSFHEAAGMSPEAAAAYYAASASTHPVGRVGTPADVAAAVLFLADSSKSGFITGTTLQIDGGRLLTSAVVSMNK